MATSTPTSLANAPDWDLTSFFPSLDSPEYSSAVGKLNELITETERYFDANQIEASNSESPLDGGVFSRVVECLNEIGGQSRLTRAYVSALVTTNSKNEEALARASELDAIAVRISKLHKRCSAWLGSGDLKKLVEETKLGKQFEFFVFKSKIEAEHQLSPAEESLVSDLELTGSTAWKKLHSTTTSQIQASVFIDGEKKTMSMSALRTLAYSADRKVRADAHAAELAAWKMWEVPLAAAMNSIKGETLLLSARRKWSSPLDAALFGAHIDGPILDAMLNAARQSFPDFRRYLAAKAKTLGIGKMAFYDLFAPLPGVGKQWDWQVAEEFVEQRFAEYSPKLANFASRAFKEKWIDYAPKPGKVDGAYCMGVRDDESRILMNYKPSFGSVSTLAHELGHGYHNLCISERPELQRFSPMTLAETASIFCETIIRKAAANLGTAEEKLAILEASLQGSCQVVVDITSRFLFESAVFERRIKRELSPNELCEIMVQAQKDTYGDGLDEAALHPYMWAAKPHYYGRAFYNFPYMFGLLFSLGLYDRFQQEGKTFQARYDDLLSSTGLAHADVLADRFGIDIRAEQFWTGSLNQIRSDIDAFIALS